MDAAQKAENPSQDQKQLLSERRQSWEAYHQQVSDYNKVVSSIAIGVAVVLLGGSILWLSGLAVIGDGVTLGAVFTLFYGLIRANMTDSEVFRFVAVAVGLVVVIGFVYVRFVRPGSRGTGSSRGTGPSQGPRPLGTKANKGKGEGWGFGKEESLSSSILPFRERRLGEVCRTPAGTFGERGCAAGPPQLLVLGRIPRLDQRSAAACSAS